MYTPKTKRIKLDGPVFTTPIRFDEDNGETFSPSISESHRTPLSSGTGSRKRGVPSTRAKDDEDGDDITAVAGGNDGTGDSPCTGAEYYSLKRELLERNNQRDHLLTKIKDLTDNNKKYRERLELRENNKKQQVHVLQKTHSTQLSDRDRLISSLQDIIQNHENTIQQLEERLHGNPSVSHTTPTPSSAFSTSPSSTTAAPVSSTLPVSPTSATTTTDPVSSKTSGTSQLVAEIKRLQDEKCLLVSQLAEAQGQVEMCQTAHIEKIAELQKSLADREKEDALRDSDKENRGQAANGDAGNCTTDTEKQLEKVQSENQRLLAEVSSLHRFYSRNPTTSYSPQAETHRRLEDENEQLRRSVSASQTALQQKELELKELESDLKAEMGVVEAEKQHLERQLGHLQNRMSSLKEHHSSWQETESNLRAEISGAHTEKRHTAQQLRDLQAKWTALQAKDPDVITKIVQVEVESEGLKEQVGELEKKLVDWEQRCGDKDRTVADLQKQIQFVNDKLEKGEEEKKLLQECLLEEVEKERQSKELAVSDARRQMEKKMYDLQVTNQQMRLKVAHLASEFENVKQAYILLSHQARQFPQMMTVVLKETNDKISRAAQEVSEENKDLVRKYHKEMRLRKKYHNELVELKGNIRVFCRVRPPIKEDGIGSQADLVVTYDPDDDGLIYVSNKGRIQTFELDRVFSSSSSQTEVFDEVRALVTSCIDGFHVCIFAYGQTGSGKTFTMEGPMSDPGINQRALQELFAETADKGKDWHYTIEVSVMEIYNETIRDLLNSDNTNKLDVKMKPEGGGYHVPGLVTKTVTTLQEVNQVFAEGKKNRATATTNMNEHSSRSHCLLCVSVTGFNRTTGSRSFGRLNLVDLAGSERVSKSGADGTRLKEAQNINKSLSCLGDVIHALRAKQTHVPFRNSKLTYLLQESLGGDSKTLMIVQVAPVEKNVSETTCSLSFGQRVRTVELGAATRKLDAGDTEMKSPTPSSSLAVSPPLKQKPLSPKSPVPVSQTRFTPSKSSPVTARVTRRTPRK